MTTANYSQVIDFYNTLWESTPTYTTTDSVYTTGGTGEYNHEVNYDYDFPAIQYKYPFATDPLVHYENVPLYGGSFPPLDMYVNEETKDVILEFAVAGVPKDNLNVTIDGDILILKIEKVEKEKKGYRKVQKGIKHSSATRKFYVPSEKYELEKIELSLEEGILNIFVPAKEDRRVKKLTIK